MDDHLTDLQARLQHMKWPQIADLARRSGVCKSTIYALRAGRQAQPRFKTVESLRHALGLQ